MRRRPITEPPEPRPFRVARWGKFWSLEPLFADERSWLVAQGGPPPRLGDVVLAVPAHGNRLRITEVLGPGTDLGAVLKALMYAERLPQGFPEEVLAEARGVQQRASAPDAGRVDLKGVPTFTIDPDTARDFDDAISVRREGDGYHAWVHIADVSYYVPAGGGIDKEARRRTSSVYLPLWAEPMLPEELSAGVCSLKPHEPRKCVTVELLFGPGGERRDTRFCRSTIWSDHRLTYGFVDAVLQATGDGVAGGASLGTAAGEPSAAVAASSSAADLELADHLRLAQELAAKLRSRRFSRGALQIGSFEPEYRFDADGRLIGAASRPETASHALVEEFMLVANEAVAEFLLKRRARALYRVHEPPDAHSVDTLFITLEDLDVPTPPLAAVDTATAGQLAAALRRLSESLPQVCAREKRGCLAFPQLLLRSLKQAFYSPQNLGHFGLASAGYLHFTSPIRRYPDLVVHRSLLKHLGLDGGELDDGELAAVAERCSTLERTIARLEMKADDIALAFLLERHLLESGWSTVFDGEIVGMVGGGLFVHFGGSYEGFLHVGRLGDERFHESSLGSALIGGSTGRRFRLGDMVRVRVDRIDKVRGRVDLDLTGREGTLAERDRQAAGQPGRGRPHPRRRALRDHDRRHGLGSHGRPH